MDKIKKHLGMIVFLVLLIIQCSYMIFWGTQKSGYYVDEFFTYDNAHYISATTPERLKLYEADYLEYNKWLDVRDIKSTLMIQREESLLNDSLAYNIKVFLTSKPYMAILNYVEAIFFEGQLNWWSSISINIICFLLNQVFMYLLTIKVCKKRNAALLATAMYGFSGMAISMLVYVRMYMWITMLVTLFTYLHVLMWDEDRHWKNILFEILALPVLFLAYRNSPLPVIYGIALIGCFSIGLFVRKKWIQAAYYCIPYLGGGMVFAFTQTDYVQIFMNPQKALQSGELDSPTTSLVHSMFTMSMSEFMERTNEMLRVIFRFGFGHFVVALMYILLVVFFIYIMIRKNKKIRNNKGTKRIGFEYVLYTAEILFFIGAIMFDLIPIRYTSFAYPILAVCVSTMVMQLGQVINKEKIITVIVVILIVGQTFYTVSIPRVENLYLEDREAVQSIQNKTGINSLVVDYHFDDRVMYECLAYTDENTKIMFSAYEDIEYTELGDSILVWQTVNKSSEDLEQNLIRVGYSTVEKIGETHESKVFLCIR